MNLAVQLLRIILFSVFSSVAEAGVAVFDPAAGTLTLRIDDLALFLAGAGGFLATGAWWLWANLKANP